jgi:arylformamidase
MKREEASINSTKKWYKDIYDISVLLGSESIVFPNDTPYSRDSVSTIESSGICNVSKLVLSTHYGTHIDAPCHFIQNAKSIDQYSVQEFILPAQVIEIKDTESIRPSELEHLDIKQGDALLFKTNNSASGRCINGIFSEHFVYLSAEAADYCAKKRVSLLGIDYATIDKYGDMNFPAHRTLLKNGILILESINLKDVPAGKYTLFCLPLKIKGGDASPVRAILAR